MPSEQITTENLDALRDEKCFPIIKGIFKELPSGLITDESNDQKELQLKMLSIMLSADLNVDQEVSYVSQSILAVLSGLNSTVQLCDIPLDNEKYKAVAVKILQIVADNIDSITLGKVTPEDTVKDFSGIKDELDKLFKEENLTQIEVKYVMDNIFTDFTTLNNAVQSSIVNSTERMEAKILGLESMSDLTLKKLNETLIG